MGPILRNIYLAEDDRDDVLFFKFALDNLNLDCKLTVVDNGQSLLDKINKDDIIPDIIFSDINMPKLDGLEALKKIRQLPGLDKILFVVYSTSTSRADIIKAFDTGASLYFEKPSSITSLQRIIEKIMQMDWGAFELIRHPQNFLIKQTRDVNLS